MKTTKGEFVAVKVEGPFTEWYSPYYKEPYEDNEAYRDFYDRKVIMNRPVIGPALGDSDNAYLSGDLRCLAERLTCMSDIGDEWDHHTENVMTLINIALECGVTYRYKFGDGEEIRITPFRKCELPPINKDSLKEFGKFSKLIKERVADI